MSESTTLNLIIASERKNIALVEPFLRSIDCFIELEESRYYNALIAVTEAVNNGIVHGNGCDPSKNVELKVECQPDQLVFHIRDEGMGFDPEGVPDPRRRENILKDGGRGVFLIRSLMDDCRYTDTGHGMILEMILHRSAQS